MNQAYKIIPKIFQYKLFRGFNHPKMYPLNLTVSVTYRCNSRCKTCNVWKKKANEFGLEEFDKTFQSIGKSPYWFTMSGGEPFLRKDIVEICLSAYDNCEPGIINIPTNGILYNIIPSKVEEIIENSPDAHIIVNLSIDGIGEKHDTIRNVEGNFEKAMKTFEGLKGLRAETKYNNFSLGIHTVISNYNVNDISEIFEYFRGLNQHSYITEIAEQRFELDTIGSNITPSLEDYKRAIDPLIRAIKQNEYSGVSKTTQAFRLEYYDLVKKVLKEKRQIIPCFAGFSSAQIAPDGDVWMCCIKADPVGNLRDFDYDFGKVWFSNKAKEIRKSIRNGDCFCPLANAHYTNMLCDFKTLIRIGMGLF